MQQAFTPVSILGVKVDQTTMDQAEDLILAWLKGQGKYYVVTPNIEFILKSQTDQDFRKILNQADLAVADSARIGWAAWMLKQPWWVRVLSIWTVLIPWICPQSNIPKVTGMDLVEILCLKIAQFNSTNKEQALTVGFLGGQNNVAKKASECLQKKYPGLKVSLAEDGPRVDRDGNEVFSIKYQVLSKENNKSQQNTKYLIPDTDLLLVAFGQIKQEKWIVNNLARLPVKVAIGVGGTFDYLSGQVARAPLWMRNLGLEWLFRLIVQPWRIKRQLQLVKFVWKIWKGK